MYDFSETYSGMITNIDYLNTEMYSASSKVNSWEVQDILLKLAYLLDDLNYGGFNEARITIKVEATTKGESDK